MPTNPEVERMATKRDATVSFNIPPFPQVPESILRRLPELRAWSREIEIWRQQTQSRVKEALDNLKSEA